MKGDFSNNKIIFTLFVSIFFSAISDYSIYIYIFLDTKNYEFSRKYVIRKFFFFFSKFKIEGNKFSFVLWKTLRDIILYRIEIANRI